MVIEMDVDGAEQKRESSWGCNPARTRTWATIASLLVGLSMSACSSESARRCAAQSDCFVGEVCVQGQCERQVLDPTEDSGSSSRDMGPPDMSSESLDMDRRADVRAEDLGPPPACTEQADCVGLRWCNTTTGQCESGCAENAQCGDNGECDTETHQCVCQTEFHLCDGVCVSSASVMSCGARCEPCPTDGVGTAVCLQGSCQLECPETARFCGDQCVSCPDSEGVLNFSCQDSQCVVAQCQEGFEPCEKGCCGQPFDPPSGPVDTLGDVGRFTSIAIARNQRPHIAYYDVDQQDLKYAFWTGRSWQVERVATQSDVGRYASLALDSNDAPHIAYYAEFGPTDAKPMLARRQQGQWGSEVIEESANAGMHTSLALDSLDRPHVGYYDLVNETIKYATQPSPGAPWSIADVDPDVGFGGGYTSIAVGSDDVPQMAYFNAFRTEARYARLSGNQWAVQTVDDPPVDRVGKYTALALDANGQPRVAYYDLSRSALKFAAPVSGAWIAGDVDGLFSDVGEYADLAIVGSGFATQPVISYYDASNGDLKLARQQNLIWNHQSIATVGDVGQYTSIAVDINDEIHISYYDSSGGLRYWSSEP